MKFKRQEGATDYENSLKLLINKLPQNQQAFALKQFCEKTGVTCQDLNIIEENISQAGFTSSTEEVISVLQNKYNELEEKYHGYFPEAQSKIVLATTGARSGIFSAFARARLAVTGATS